MRFNKVYLMSSVMLLLLISNDTNAQRALSFSNLTVENGLSQNSVLAIAQDSLGFIWLGTRQGINRYDGYNFKIYNTNSHQAPHLEGEVTSLLTDFEGTLWAGTTTGLKKYHRHLDRFEKTQGLSSANIEVLYQDDAKNLWIGSLKGLYLLTDKKKNKFKVFYLNSKQSHPLNRINSIYKTKTGAILLGTGGGLVIMEYKNGSFNYRKIDLGNNLQSGYVTAIAADKQQRIWLGTTNGLYLLDHQFKLVKVFLHSEINYNSLIHNDVREILPINPNLFYIGTQNGLSVLNLQTETFVNYQHNPDDTESLSHNSIHHIFKDRYQNTWIGTYFGGVNLAYPVATKFKVYRNSKAPNSLSGNVVSTIVADERNNLWMGTEGGGLNYLNRSSELFMSYKHDPANNESISSNIVKTLIKDPFDDKKLIIGTHRGVVNIFDKRTGKFNRIANVKDANGTIGTAEIIALAADSSGTVWIGSMDGITMLEQKNGVYPSITKLSPLSKALNTTGILSLLYDSRNNLWIGTNTGFYRYDLGTKKLRKLNIGTNSRSLQANQINCIVEAKDGHLLLGTYLSGLTIYNPDKNTFKTYRETDGLINNNVLGVVEDSEGNLWISTAKGLSELHRKTGRFRNYTKSDGLAGNEFNARSYFRDRNGEIFLGGINGLTAFYPKNVETNNYVSPLAFTDLRLFNNTVSVNEDSPLLNKHIDLKKELDFAYNQNNFTLEFALLNYVKPDKNKYTYKLEDYDKDWIVATKPIATYTNLPAGNYRFIVKAANNDGISGVAPRMLNIHISPAPWLSWWAYLGYFLILSAILFSTLRYFFVRALLKRTENVQQLKLKFFTNVSHEIRTPLTLILGPLENLIKSTKDLPEINNQLLPIKNNTDRLLRLVTELMDFRKTETGHLKLKLIPCNIESFVNQIFLAFKDLALSRNISYRFSSSIHEKTLWIDTVQMEKVFFNLLSNAFKFTPNHGQIEVAIAETHSEIKIEVKDNGVGIPLKDRDQLFSDFFQVDPYSTDHIGSGIGLALTKSIVVAHGGKITIDSTPSTDGQPGNTCFTILLSKHQPDVADEEATLKGGEPTTINENVLQTIVNPALDDTEANEQETLLIVEDNTEIRALLKSLLNPQYKVIECDNGQKGWETATEILPNLIICDIMMPVMNGLQLCRKLKTDDRTSHIPVILLTAMDTQPQQVDGLETGADSYITKPFSTELLLLNIRNLLQARKIMRKKYAEQVGPQPYHITGNKVDHHFMRSVTDFITQHLADTNFVVQDLANEVGMSQPVLYKKIRAITDLSVNDFIKSVRLKKAAELLTNTDHNVAEISYLVGFNDTKYFSREFKKYFGQNPKTYAQTHRKDAK